MDFKLKSGTKITRHIQDFDRGDRAGGANFSRGRGPGRPMIDSYEYAHFS